LVIIYAISSPYEQGYKKSQMSITKTLLSGLLAGCLVACGALLALVTGGSAAASGLAPVVQKLLFSLTLPTGFWFILSTGVDLFTGDTLFMAVGYLQGRVTGVHVLRTWFLVYIANFLGAALFAALFSLCAETLGTADLTEANAVRDYAISITIAKVTVNSGRVFVRGIGCGWLVTTGVATAIGGGEMISKLIVAWVAFAAFALLGFEHANSNMFILTNGLMYGANTNFGVVLWWNIIPASLGNIVGGAGVVGTLYWYLYLFDENEIACCRKEHDVEVRL
jgi:formate/nitrite transporter